MTDPRKNIPAITGLRGVTVISVVFMHFAGTFRTLLPELGYFIDVIAKLGFRMDLFFLLSGFMAAYVFIRPGQQFTLRSHLDFLGGRLLRLYPSFFIVFVVLMAGVWISSVSGTPTTGSYPMMAVPARLAWVHAWPSFTWTTPTWNYPTWFLSALWFAYLFIFPVGVILRQRGSFRKWMAAWVFVPILLGICLCRIHALHEFGTVIHVSCQFFAGMALCEIFRHGGEFMRSALRRSDIIAAVFIGSAFLIPLFSEQSVWINIWLIIATPLLLLAITNENAYAARLLAIRPVVWLGKISYSIFLTHAIIQKAFKFLVPEQAFAGSNVIFRGAVFALYLGSILAAAAALYYCVEVPVAKIRKRMSLGPTRQHSREVSAGAEAPAAPADRC